MSITSSRSERYGHAVGDDVLKYLGAIQLRTAIESDVSDRPPALTGPVTVSIGVASRTDQTSDPKELMGLPTRPSIRGRMPAEIERASSITY
jgi:GGDEF domain-containing protein